MLMKARTAKDIHMGIIAFLYTDKGTQGLIDMVKSGKQKVLQVRSALTKYLNGNVYNHIDVIPATKTHEEVTPEIIRERAQRVLEEIKDVKSEKGKEGRFAPKIEELIAQFKAGKFDPLFDYINDAKSKHSKTKRKKILIKFKDELLSIAKKIQNDELKASTIKRLEAIDWEFKEGTKEYKLTGKPSPQKIVEYYTLVFSNKSNLTSANRSKMIPKVGAANIFGSKKNVLYPALEDIIEENNFTLDDELRNKFRKQKTKLSISKKKALINLANSTSVMPTGIANLSALSEEATELEEKEVLKLIESDQKYEEAFNDYVEHLQQNLTSISRSIPKEDYDVLESELENKDIVAREYGFDDYQDWDNWMDEKAGRNAAWDALEEVNNRKVVNIKKLADVKLLSNMFSEADVDIKGSLSTASSIKIKESLNDNKFDNLHVLVEDVIEMLSNLAEAFETTEFDQHVLMMLHETDETELNNLVDECVKRLESRDYQAIRYAFLNATIERMSEIASKSILLAEEEDENIAGQMEPLDVLRELGLLQAVNI
tara:strand:+ start:11318 stop:12946 length:1629 start_codon:yes stop_codon:yes gene_type:complete